VLRKEYLIEGYNSLNREGSIKLRRWRGKRVLPERPPAPDYPTRPRRGNEILLKSGKWRGNVKIKY